LIGFSFLQDFAAAISDFLIKPSTYSMAHPPFTEIVGSSFEKAWSAEACQWTRVHSKVWSSVLDRKQTVCERPFQRQALRLCAINIYLSTMLPRSSMHLEWHKEKRHRHRRQSLPLKGLLGTSRCSLVLCAADRLIIGDASSAH